MNYRCCENEFGGLMRLCIYPKFTSNSFGLTILTMWQKLWTEARRCFPQSYWSVIGLVGRERRCVSELREGEGGAFRLHNKVGASEIEEGRENAAEGRTRLSVALGQRDTQRFSSLVFWLFTAPHFLFLFCHSSPLCSHSFCSTDFPFTDTVSPCSLCYTVLHLDNSFILTHGYLTVSFSFCLPSSSPSFFVNTTIFSHPLLCFSLCLSLIFFGAPVIHPSIPAWYQNACPRGTLGPRSQDAGHRSWCWGLSRGASWFSSLGSPQDSSCYMWWPLPSPGATSSYTATQSSVESTQGRLSGAREKSSKSLGGIRKRAGRRDKAGHRKQECTCGR